MHELPLVKTIFQSVNAYAMSNDAKKVKTVNLQVGVLRELIPELINKYWKYVTRDTVVEGSTLIIEEIPASAKCSNCEQVYVIDYEHIEEAKCPHCGHTKGYLLTGREVILQSIEIDK